jgi:hypothetical protein
LNVDTSPFKTVLDKAHDVKNIKPIPKTAIPMTENKAAKLEKDEGTTAPIKMVAIKICVGHRPLQSEKLLVIIAMRRSLGLSIILVATTPAALQPKPILMVKACLP